VLHLSVANLKLQFGCSKLANSLSSAVGKRMVSASWSVEVAEQTTFIAFKIAINLGVFVESNSACWQSFLELLYCLVLLNPGLDYLDGALESLHLFPFQLPYRFTKGLAIILTHERNQSDVVSILSFAYNTAGGGELHTPLWALIFGEPCDLICSRLATSALAMVRFEIPLCLSRKVLTPGFEWYSRLQVFAVVELLDEDEAMA
jgi:hypothetical protein